MKHKRLWMLSILLILTIMLSTTAFAVDETEVESAIAASSREEVAGNLFIWFLCAIAFLKVSQKIDSFMSSLGINVGRTGGSMLGELLLAGKAMGAAVKATGGAVGSIFNRNHTSSSTTNRAAGQGFTSSAPGLIGVAQRAAGNAAASSTTGRGTGLGSFVGGAMFGSSLKNGGKLASDVVGAVATGNIATMGSITGGQAVEALTSYLGYGSGQSEGIGAVDADDNGIVIPPVSSDIVGTGGSNVTPPVGHIDPAVGAVTPETKTVPMSAAPEDRITMEGGMAAGAVAAEASSPQAPSNNTLIQSQPPVFRNVEIGGGRITGYETPAGGGTERQFAMYNAEQYMEPTGCYETVQTTDGQSWYKQYAEPTVQRTPYEDGSGKIKYDEKIVDQMPQIPKRKDRV